MRRGEPPGAQDKGKGAEQRPGWSVPGLIGGRSADLAPGRITRRGRQITAPDARLRCAGTLCAYVVCGSRFMLRFLDRLRLGLGRVSRVQSPRASGLLTQGQTKHGNTPECTVPSHLPLRYPSPTLRISVPTHRPRPSQRQSPPRARKYNVDACEPPPLAARTAGQHHASGPWGTGRCGELGIAMRGFGDRPPLAGFSSGV